MPVPSPRNKILPVRGNIASLNAALADLLEGEICYALDEDQYYQKEGGVLVPVGATKAQGLLADSAIQPGDNVSELTNDAAYVDAAGAAAAAPVQSVAGKTGAVTLVKGDVGLGNVDNTSDLNKPISTATQSALDLKADLVGGVIPNSQLPSLAISEYLGSVNSQAAMLALTGQRGDWCIRTDTGSTWVITTDGGSLLSHWTQLATPADAVTSVNGYTGTVVLGKADVGLGNVDNTSDLNKPVSTATQTALDLKANLTSPALTGTPTAPTATPGTNTTQLATTAFVADAVSTADEWTRTDTTLAPKTAGDVVAVSAGTGALPGLTPVGDPNTGLYSPGADQLAISTGGTGRVFVDASGKLGLGTSSPRTLFNLASATGPALTIENTSTTVTGTGSYGSLDWYGNDATTGASGIRAQIQASSRGSSGECALDFGTSSTGAAVQTRMRIDEQGRVGIGTTSPTQDLDLRNSGSAAVFQIVSGVALTDSTSTLQLVAFSSASAVAGTAKINSTAPAGGQSELSFLTSPSGNAPVERVRIDSSGRLLVGTNSARANFNNSTTTALIQAEGTAGVAERGMISVVNNSTADDPPWVYIAKSNGASVGSNTLVGSTTWLGVLGFGGNDGTDFVTGAHIAAQVDGTPGANDMPCRLIFSTTADGASNPTERARITSDGYLRLAATNSLGIQFNGDTAAANALDDYEEGTFTPTIVGVTTAGTGTYSNQIGRYTKIGNAVSFYCRVTWSAHTGTGAMRISGLPFTSANVTSAIIPCATWYSQLTSPANTIVSAYVLTNSTQVVLATETVAGGTSANVTLDTAADLAVSGTYFV